MLRSDKNKRQRTKYKPSLFKKGLTLPGYNYLGPFNSLDNGEPTNHSDKVAYKHDKAYSELIKKYGKFRTYTKFSQADADFIRNAGDDFGGRAGKAFFNFKKRVAGNIDPKSPASKRLRGEPHLTATRPNRVLRGSQPNLQPTTQMTSNGPGTANGSGLDAGLSETPIDAVTDVKRGPPDYTFASLPWLRTQRVDQNLHAYDMAIRMTSPYDCIPTQNAIDNNVGAGTMTDVETTSDAVDTKVDTYETARWFDMYAGLYKYYHVVSARWWLTIENLGNELIYVHQMYYNDQLVSQIFNC